MTPSGPVMSPRGPLRILSTYFFCSGVSLSQLLGVSMRLPCRRDTVWRSWSVVGDGACANPRTPAIVAKPMIVAASLFLFIRVSSLSDGRLIGDDDFLELCDVQRQLYRPGSAAVCAEQIANQIHISAVTETVRRILRHRTSDTLHHLMRGRTDESCQACLT